MTYQNKKSTIQGSGITGNSPIRRSGVWSFLNTIRHSDECDWENK